MNAEDQRGGAGSADCASDPRPVEPMALERELKMQEATRNCPTATMIANVRQWNEWKRPSQPAEPTLLCSGTRAHGRHSAPGPREQTPLRRARIRSPGRRRPAAGCGGE